MFSNFITLVSASSMIRWLSVEKSANDSTSYAIVKVEGAKPNDKIYLMETSTPKDQNSWVPKSYYYIPENASETMKLPLPETLSDKSYALALQDSNGDMNKQPVYSKPFTCNGNNKESMWMPVENGRFDQGADAASKAAGKMPMNDKTAGAKNAEKSGAAAKAKSSSAKNSASGAVFSVALVSAVFLSMMM